MNIEEIIKLISSIPDRKNINININFNIEETSRNSISTPQLKIEEAPTLTKSKEVKVPLIPKYNYDYNKEIDDKLSPKLLEHIKDTINNDIRIVISSTQWASYGGSATNAYNLTKFYRKLGIRVACIFHEANKKIEENNVNLDPDGIGGVFNLPRIGHRQSIPKSLKPEIEENKAKIIEYLGGEPNFGLAKNYISPKEWKSFFPDMTVVYLVSGSPHMTLASKDGLSYRKIMDTKDYHRYLDAPEVKRETASCEVADFITTNSLNAEQLSLDVFEEEKSKLTPYLDTSFASVINGEIIKIDNRKFDLVYISSRCDRKIKNAEFCSKIFGSPELAGYSKLVIGDGAEEYFPGIPNITYMASQANNVIIKYLCNSRLLLNTSFYDASPNTIREAISCGCNVLTSKNVGYWETFNPLFICEDVYEIDEWVEKIKNILSIKESISNYSDFAKKNFENISLKFIYNYSYKLHTNKKKVYSEHETLDMLIGGYSISRLTDSEYKLISGGDGKDQEYNADLSRKLKEIVQMDPIDKEKNKLLIGTLNVYGNNIFGLLEDRWISHITRYNKLLNSSVYGSSFVSRPDQIDGLMTNDYFNKWKKVWNDKNIVYVHWTDKPQKLFGNCNTIKYVICPKTNAYGDFDRLLEEITKCDTRDLILMSCGATATVLAYELAIKGYTAMDIGVLPSLYNKMVRINAN